MFWSYIIIIYKKTLHLIKNQQKQPITLVIPYLRLATRISFFLSCFAHIATTDANLVATTFRITDPVPRCCIEHYVALKVNDLNIWI